MATGPSPLGDLLRGWRDLRGLSQLELALTTGVSSRHLSFLETGRSQPSRRMVLGLADALELPLRERNTLLLAAGYAPVYEERPLDGRRMQSVRRALQLVLRSHEPYPAFVLDRFWNIVEANDAHYAMLRLLAPANYDTDAANNVMRLVFDPKLLKPRIRNWDRVAQVLEKRIRQSLRVPEPDPKLKELHDQILAMPDVARIAKQPVPLEDVDLLIPLEFELGGIVLSWFSMIANIGTAQDVTLEEIRLESLFPADDQTEEFVRSSLGSVN